MALAEVTVVVITRNRVDELLGCLARLVALPERPPVIVVDNGSRDGTAGAVRGRFPAVEVVALDGNAGAAARNVGVVRATTPYVAFADDDSWWAPEALARACAVLDAHDRVGLVAARILVGPDEHEDPTNRLMAESPLGAAAGGAGPAILGFVACGAVVRRRAFLQAGGFDTRLGIGGEEDLLALDLAARGWELVYRHDVVAHHHPSPSRDPEGRRRRVVRNDAWTAWLRLPLPQAVEHTVRLAGRAGRAPAGRRGLLDALVGLPGVLRDRHPVPPSVAARHRVLHPSVL